MGSQIFCEVSLTSLNGDRAFSWSQLCTPDSSPWAGEALGEESHGGTAEVDGPDAAQPFLHAPREEVAVASQENCSFFGSEGTDDPFCKAGLRVREGLGKRSSGALAPPHCCLRTGTCPLPMTQLSCESVRPRAARFLGWGSSITSSKRTAQNSD